LDSPAASRYIPPPLKRLSGSLFDGVHGMDTLEANKIVGAILVGGLVMMITGIMGHMLVSPKSHGEAAAISGGEAGGGGGGEAAPAAPAVIEPIAPLLAKADPAKGQQIAAKCQACHDFSKGGPNKIGPDLWGIVDSKPAEVPGYNFSDAMKAREDKPWTYEALNEFLTAPRSFVHGTKMTFAGLSKIEDRADVIAWLRTLSDNPVPLPSAADIAAAEKAYQDAKAAAAKPAASAAPAAGTTGTASTATAAQPAANTGAAASGASTSGASTSGAATSGSATTGAAAATTATAGTASTGTATAGAATSGGATGGTATAGSGVPPIAERLKTADVNKGAEISKKCLVCHSFTKGGGNKIGPNLWGIVGSKPAEVPDYSFSDAMKAREDKPWTYEALDEYLISPRKDVPGTKMTFAGLSKPQDRADLIAWLRQQSDSPLPLP
jgi:cytochrome c